MISVLMAAGLVGCAAPAAFAQAPASTKPSATQPVRRGKAYRQPLVNLEKQAQSRRSGQVLPGDPPPEKFAAPMEESKSPAALPSASRPPAPAPVMPDNPRDATDPKSGKPVKAAPMPVDPASGPRGGGAGAPAGASRRDLSPEPLDAGVTPEPGSATASADADAGSPKFGSAALPGAAAIRVLSLTGDSLQWRDRGGEWKSMAAGETASSPIELRTGLEAEATLEIDDRVEIRVGRLTRITIERRSTQPPMPAITIERGSVDLRARSKDLVECWIRTPDRSAGFATFPGVRIAYSAFSGTSVQTGAPEIRP